MTSWLSYTTFCLLYGRDYIFAGSHESAWRAAIIYALLGTCKLKGVEPFAWLRNVPDAIPDYKANRLKKLQP
jgi:hypothetical protein